MAYRDSSDYQSRYESRLSPPASPAYPPGSPSGSGPASPLPVASRSRSPEYAPLAQPTPPHLAHARYSSADLYAVSNAAHSPPLEPEHERQEPLLAHDGRQAGGGQRLQPATQGPGQGRGTWHDSDDSDSDDDGGAGFGTYRDFQSVQNPARPRASQRLSTAPTLSSLPNYGNHGNGSTYALREHRSSTAKFDSMSHLGGVAGAGGAGKQSAMYEETVALPKISRDWEPGEGLDEKNDRKYARSRRKRREAKGVMMEYVDWAKRRWRWLLPAFIAFLVALVLALYFCIPRTPTVTFFSSKVPKKVFTSTDENPFITSTEPVGYSFAANLIFAIDASDSYVPVKYSSFGLTVKLRETGGVIGTETWTGGAIEVPGKKVTSYEFPMMFSGNYSSASDPTFAIMKSSCAHIYPTTYRAPLNLTIEVESSIVGVIGAPTRTASVAVVDCPIQWSGSAN
ncbi:hypothetical protein JCM10212_001527 [Sporobolomyces blumeae]